MVAVLIVIGILFAIAAYVSLNRDDNITSLAFIKPPELREFMKECRDTGGKVDVRNNEAPPIVFECQYEDRIVEYTLQTGK